MFKLCIKQLKSFLLTFFGFSISTYAYAQEQTQAAAQAAQDVSIIDNMEKMTAEQIDTVKNLVNILIEFCVKYSFQVLGGFIVLILGWITAGYICKLVHKFLTGKGVDITVSKFITSAVKITVMAFAVIVALGKFGIEIAPLIAGISVAGFGLSFALQGPLSNYAAGITLVFTKPFKVGEIIEVAGVNGEVTDMKLARTDIRTVDGERIFIPNKHIIGEVIHNFSDNKRIDLSVGVSYSTDMDKAIKVVTDVIKADKRITKDPRVGISEFADSSVNILARVWCKQKDYWAVMFELNRNIFAAFKKEGINIPFPQRDVTIVNK